MPVLANIVAPGLGGGFSPAFTLGATPTPGELTAGSATAAGVGIATGSGSIRERLILSSPQLAGAGIGIAALAGSSAAKAAIPFVGPALVGVSIAFSLWKARKGPYQKVATTQIVNEAEPILQDNLKAYFEGPRTTETQAWALANFDDIWNQIEQLCGDPAMGEPGRRCIAERRRGGVAPWCPSGSGCDWFILYRDPIANDPGVKPAAPPPAASAIERLFTGGEAAPGADAQPSLLWPVLGAGLIAAAVLL
jgi:hypothetical protein